MPLRKEKNPLDAKLTDLERELREVRRSMRTAARGDRPAAPARVSPAASPPSAAPAAGTPDPDARHGELFAYASRDRAGGDAGPRRSRGEAAEDKQRFARYFAGSSFVGGPPMRETRRLQRNKAIFMVIVVIVVGFILYSFLR